MMKWTVDGTNRQPYAFSSAHIFICKFAVIMTGIAKFNIGGQRYEVSRSLLESNPDTMLAKSASDQWQEDPESEIFIERDGQRFRFVLDYLRDGKVCLPSTETKDAFMAELEYYNINVDIDKIVRKVKVNDAILARDCVLDRLEKSVKSCAESAKDTTIQHRCAEIALFCCKGVFRQRKMSDGGWKIKAGIQQHAENGGKECYASVMELKKVTTDTQGLMDHVNHFLKDHGLELYQTDAFTFCTEEDQYLDLDIKEADQH